MNNGSLKNSLKTRTFIRNGVGNFTTKRFFVKEPTLINTQVSEVGSFLKYKELEVGLCEQKA